MTKSGFQKLSTGLSDALQTRRWGSVRMRVQPEFAFRNSLAILQEGRNRSMAVVWISGLYGMSAAANLRRDSTLPRLLKKHEVKGSCQLNSVWLQYWESFFWKSADKHEYSEHLLGWWTSENLRVGGIRDSKACFAGRSADLEHDGFFQIISFPVWGLRFLLFLHKVELS